MAMLIRPILIDSARPTNHVRRDIERQAFLSIGSGAINCADVSAAVCPKIPDENIESPRDGFDRNNPSGWTHQTGSQRRIVPNIGSHVNEGITRLQPFANPSRQVRLPYPEKVNLTPARIAGIDFQPGTPSRRGQHTDLGPVQAMNERTPTHSLPKCEWGIPEI